MRRDVAILSGNGAEEALDFRTEFHGRLLDLLGSGKDGLRRAARLRHPGRDIAKRGDHGLAPRGGAGDVVRNLPGRQFLLLDRAGNLGGVGIDLLHPARDRADRGDRSLGRALDRRNLPGDLFSRFRRLHRQRLHLRSYHGKAAAGGAGARRLDRSIERKLIQDIAEQTNLLAISRSGVPSRKFSGGS
jgi:hypothetical protein